MVRGVSGGGDGMRGAATRATRATMSTVYPHLTSQMVPMTEIGVQYFAENENNSRRKNRSRSKKTMEIKIKMINDSITKPINEMCNE